MKLPKPTYNAPIVLDIETKDFEISKLGPGVYHDPDAYILGCGVYDPMTGDKTYYPLHGCRLAESYLQKSRAALAKILANPREKLLANALYDLDWLENGEGLPVNGFIHDVQIAEPLLDQYRLSYSLDSLAHYYNVKGKQTTDIQKYADEIDPKRKEAPQHYLWLMPAEVVGEYCLGDLEATYEVWKKQMPLLEAQKLKNLYEVECNLVRVCLMMRKNGIRIDMGARESAIAKVQAMEDNLLLPLRAKWGDFRITATQDLAPILLNEGVNLPKTRTGKWSVTKEILQDNENTSPVCHTIFRARQLNKLRTSFLEKSIDDYICPDGRIHCSFHPLKKDGAGTITGRWSCTNPNLQQIPRNDKELGAMARGMFIPDEGCWYGHTDYSQVEYRVFAHYARGLEDGDELDKAAQAMRDLFNARPDTDYHQYVIDLVKELTGVEFDRPTAKRVNFGTLYFMGAASLSRKFGIPFDEADNIVKSLFRALPFIDSTRNRVVKRAKIMGEIRTAGGRIQRVGPQHIPINRVVKFPNGRTVTGKNIEDRGEKFYPLFNYLIQGTAADVMKFALIDCYESGVYDVLNLHLLVHDETGTSIPKTLEGIQAYEEQQYLMGNALPLKVPILADADFGDNWGVMIGEGNECFPKMYEAIGLASPHSRVISYTRDTGVLKYEARA